MNRGLGSRVRLAACYAMLIVVASGAATAQELDPKRFDGLLGATPPDPALAEGLPGVSLSRAYLPSAIDLSPMMPPPVQQELGSCVAHAVGYATRGYYAAIERDTKPGDPANTPSPAFLHSQIAGWMPNQPRQPDSELCKKSGSSALVAMLYLIDNGSVSNRDVPIDRICQPDVTSMKVGKNEYSIKDGKVIYVGGKGPFGNPELDKIKQSLAAGHPVVIGMSMYKYSAEPGSGTATLQALHADEIYRGSLGKHYGKMDTGHELVIVAYDDGRQAFRVENSWGTDWADGGFGWIGYDAARADIGEAVVMDAGVTPPRPDPVRPKREQANVAQEGQCALVFKTSDQQGGTYEGFVENEAELAELRKQHAGASMDQVAIRPWPVCETLLTLDQPLGAPSRPKIAFDGGDGDKVKFGDLVGFSVTAPDFPSFLYVVYLQADGMAVNLVPRGGPLRKQLAPGAVLKFGDGKEGRQKFRAAAPAGPEAIVAIAARSPLAQLEALETGGTGQFRLAAGQQDAEGQKDAQDRLYLSLLRAALLDTPDPQQMAREVTADVLHITVSEK